MGTHEKALEAAGLVERLREGTCGSDITKTDPYLNGIMREAASLIQSQAARIAELDDARRSLKYWVDGTEIIERCLARSREAKPEDAPFGMDRSEAQIWHQAQERAYQHALEMMGVPTASGPMIRAAALLTKDRQP